MLISLIFINDYYYYYTSILYKNNDINNGMKTQQCSSVFVLKQSLFKLYIDGNKTVKSTRRRAEYDDETFAELAT